ncbi:hypothetical protein L3X38_001839 [Prunus dulcis]|uniref:Uncharacterized protein n=1 Tax=Prunus dulcis TaxID=3755 RepID=A0AAD4ZJE3_PRUDU|nr:hypothetical protein L3X38_001839 [Prunus dulcis]
MKSENGCKQKQWKRNQRDLLASEAVVGIAGTYSVSVALPRHDSDTDLLRKVAVAVAVAVACLLYRDEKCA